MKGKSKIRDRQSWNMLDQGVGREREVEGRRKRKRRERERILRGNAEVAGRREAYKRTTYEPHIITSYDSFPKT